MRNKIVAGNWKMNLTFDEAETLVDDILDRLDEQDELNCEIIICPPFPYLEMLTDYEFDEQRFNVGAQNCSAYDKGAYTGEVSAKMLKSIDVDYCIIGHSERRKYFGETNEVLAEKINRLIENNMSPIYCVGEVLEEREAGRHFEVVKEQLEKGLLHLDGDAIYDTIIAYEPVWAIGSRNTMMKPRLTKSASSMAAAAMPRTPRNCSRSPMSMAVSSVVPRLRQRTLSPSATKPHTSAKNENT